MPVIKKIQQLSNVEGFLQVNFVKGYKYIDKAGEIVNYFHKNEKPPKFSMDLNGLIISNPDEKIELIKISSNTFWAHFLSPDSLEQMDNFFGKTAGDVVRTLEIEKISRLGWRMYFVYEFADEEKREQVLKKFAPVKGLKFEDVTYLSECKKIALNFKIRKVVKIDESGLPGLLLDIDFYKQYKELLPSGNIGAQLTEFKNMIRSDEFLEVLNSLLAE